MNAAEKRKFIRTFSRSIEASMLAAVPHMPDTWDGHELRALFAAVYAFEARASLAYMKGRRKRSFDNERAVNYKIP